MGYAQWAGGKFTVTNLSSIVSGIKGLAEPENISAVRSRHRRIVNDMFWMRLSIIHSASDGDSAIEMVLEMRKKSLLES